MEITVPGNTDAELWIPETFSSVVINGEKANKTASVNHAGGKRSVFILKSGKFSISAQ